MRYIFFTLLVLACHKTEIVAQTSPSITYDPATRNYLLRFQGEAGLVEVVFEPPTKVEPTIECNIFPDAISSSLTYSYRVRNGASAKQRLISFSVRADVPEGYIDTPNAQWTKHKRYAQNLVTWAHTKANIYGVLTGFNGIPPDSIARGFMFRSTGLPVITLSYSQGAVKTMSFPEEPPPEIDSLLTPLQVFPNNSVSRETIGPKQPSAPFDATIFLDTLLSYTRQSAELGWLGRDRDNDCDNDEKPEDGIVRNIDHRLNKAKRQLERGDSVLARRELEKLVGKVERLWKRSQDDEERKHGKDRKNWWQRDKGDHVVMTSEAYALLKYNTEYLIDRLPDRKPKKGSKDRD